MLAVLVEFSVSFNSPIFKGLASLKANKGGIYAAHTVLYRELRSQFLRTGYLVVHASRVVPSPSPLPLPLPGLKGFR